MRKFLGGDILLVYSWIKVLLMITGFEGFHDGYIIYSHMMYTRKLFKENKGSGECEQTIVKGNNDKTS